VGKLLIVPVEKNTWQAQPRESIDDRLGLAA
jgi:hypothetical protein